MAESIKYNFEWKKFKKYGMINKNMSYIKELIC